MYGQLERRRPAPAVENSVVATTASTRRAHIDDRRRLQQRCGADGDRDQCRPPPSSLVGAAAGDLHADARRAAPSPAGTARRGGRRRRTASPKRVGTSGAARTAPTTAMPSPTAAVRPMRLPRPCARPRPTAGISTSGIVAVAKNAAPPIVDSTPKRAASSAVEHAVGHEQVGRLHDGEARTTGDRQRRRVRRTASGGHVRPAGRGGGGRRRTPQRGVAASTTAIAAPSGPIASARTTPATRRTAGSMTRLAPTRREPFVAVGERRDASPSSTGAGAAKPRAMSSRRASPRRRRAVRWPRRAPRPTATPVDGDSGGEPLEPLGGQRAGGAERRRRGRAGARTGRGT